MNVQPHLEVSKAPELMRPGYGCNSFNVELRFAVYFRPGNLQKYPRTFCLITVQGVGQPILQLASSVAVITVQTSTRQMDL